MESFISERKLINFIRSTIIDNNLCDANKMTRFAPTKSDRVYYIVQSRNKAVSLLISSPIKEDQIVEVESKQVLTILKLFRGRSFLVKGFTPINVGSPQFRRDLSQFLKRELKNVHDIDFKIGWSEFASAKDGTQQKIHRAIMYGERVLTEKQIRDISNQNIAMSENETGGEKTS